MKEVSELGIIKRCELCLKYINCFLYDEVCENLEFLRNFLDLNNSNEIANYCKNYKNAASNNLNIKLPF